MTPRWVTERRCPRADGDLSPCPWIGCRHHLWVEASRSRDKSRRNGRRLDLELCPTQLQQTCAVDVAMLGELTLAAVGNLFGVTRERIRMIELRAAARFAASARELGHDPADLLPEEPLFRQRPAARCRARVGDPAQTPTYSPVRRPVAAAPAPAPAPSLPLPPSLEAHRERLERRTPRQARRRAHDRSMAEKAERNGKGYIPAG